MGEGNPHRQKKRPKKKRLEKIKGFYKDAAGSPSGESRVEDSKAKTFLYFFHIDKEFYNSGKSRAFERFRFQWNQLVRLRSQMNPRELSLILSRMALFLTKEKNRSSEACRALDFLKKNFDVFKDWISELALNRELNSECALKIISARKRLGEKLPSKIYKEIERIAFSGRPTIRKNRQERSAPQTNEMHLQ